jgi:cell division protein FtsL
LFTANETTANASFISNKSISFNERPLFLITLLIASAGAVVNSIGAFADDD